MQYPENAVCKHFHLDLKGTLACEQEMLVKIFICFLRFELESNWISCAGVEVANDCLKMRVLDTSGCRISLSLCSTRQVCHLNYYFHLNSMWSQWRANTELGWGYWLALFLWTLLTALGACRAVRVLQEGKVLSRGSVAACLQKDSFVVQCL